jgi:hypothetical protein
MNRAGADDDLGNRVDHIEAAYEFMLAYAAQGRDGRDAGRATQEIRDQLRNMAAALEGLAASCRTRAAACPSDSLPFIDVVDSDASKALAAVRLVLAQAALSSQLIDNLNASIHLRALLTDLFLIDEATKRIAAL